MPKITTIDDKLKELQVNALSTNIDTQQLDNEYVISRLDKLLELKQEPYQKKFVNQNVIGQSGTPQHIMFKLRMADQEGREMTSYTDKDGNRYEFLIEFDLKDYAWDIYYGCKVITYKNMHKNASFWNTIREEVAVGLNNTFHRDDFMSEMCHTDNKQINDNGCCAYTYWPIWIRLSKGEDISVAATATALIFKIATLSTSEISPRQKVHLDSSVKEQDENAHQTSYTESAYWNVIQEIAKCRTKGLSNRGNDKLSQNGKNNYAETLNSFISNAVDLEREKNGENISGVSNFYLKESDKYLKAWKICNCKNQDFDFMMQILWDEFLCQNKREVEEYSKGTKGSCQPYKTLYRLFLNKKGKPFNKSKNTRNQLLASLKPTDAHGKNLNEIYLQNLTHYIENIRKTIENILNRQCDR